MASASLIESFENYVREQSLLRAGDRLAVGVSGGLDSTVLLHLLMRISRPWGLRLAVGHVHHGLRGASADRDEAFVRDRCRRDGLRFYAWRCDVAAYRRNRRSSEEEAARRLRLGFLESMLDRLGLDALALGHHADDRAETILMHLVRGSGVRGLAGIRPRRGRIIHPLLFATREELASYAEEHGLDHVIDRSNRNRKFLRNRVRESIVPAMRKAFDTDVVRGIGRSGDHAGEAQHLLDALTLSAVSECAEIKNPHEIRLDIERFLGYFSVVQKRMISHILEDRQGLGRLVRSSEFERILDLTRRSSGRKVLLDDAWNVVRSRDTLVFCRIPEGFEPGILQEGGAIWIREIGVRISARRVEKRAAAFTNRPDTEVVDGDRLRFPLAVRPVRRGDWFVPLRLKGRKKLQDFFVDEGVPSTERSRIPIVLSGDDIVWVAGHRLDHRFRVTEGTEHFFRLEVEYRGVRTYRNRDKDQDTDG